MPGDRATQFQEGYEHARAALFPPPPDGYRRGRAEHTAFVDIGLIVCEACGAVVGDVEVHDAWHTRFGVTAMQAHRADAMTSPIGGKPDLTPSPVVDLMQALQDSVDKAKAERRRAGEDTNAG